MTSFPSSCVTRGIIANVGGRLRESTKRITRRKRTCGSIESAYVDLIDMNADLTLDNLFLIGSSVPT